MHKKHRKKSLFPHLLPKAGRLTTGTGKTCVNVIYLTTPAGITAFYYGGKSHLGSVTAGLHILSRSFHKTYCREGHRDDLVTRKAEKILCHNRSGFVLTGAGIHYDNATRPEIKALVRNTEYLSRRVARLSS